MTTPDALPPNWCRRHFQMGALLTLLGVLSSVIPRPAHAAFDEHQVKAVWIYNFTQFVRWSPNSFPDSESPFTIGVLGDDPFGGALAAAVKGETIQGRKFAIKRSRNVGALKGCQIIFVSKSESSRLGEILGAVARQGILTVGESPGFCAQGGVFNFTLAGGTVGVEVSIGAAAREGLKINAQLLQKCKRLP